MQPVELVCLSDNKESAVEELVIETDMSDCEGISNCVVAWDSLNNKMREVLPCISTSGGSAYTYFVEKYEDLIQEEFSVQLRNVSMQNSELTCILKKKLTIGLQIFLCQVNAHIARPAHISRL